MSQVTYIYIVEYLTTFGDWRMACMLDGDSAIYASEAEAENMASLLRSQAASDENVRVAKFTRE